MSDLENPAGRLYELLDRFRSDQNRQIVDAWAAALEVDREGVRARLGQVALLVGEVRAAARDTGSPHFAPMDNHLDSLLDSILPFGQPLSNPVSKAMPDVHAMNMLGTLSFALQQTARDGAIPDDGELDELKTLVRELIAEVQAVDLDPEIRRMFVQRLAEMREALDHLTVGGPDRVRRAAEALASAVALHASTAGADDVPAGKLMQLAQRAYDAVSKGTALARDALTWYQVFKATGLLPGDIAPPQLPPGGASVDGKPRSRRRRGRVL